MGDTSLLRAVRHSCWANAKLIASCADLSPERLAWTSPGTFGTIHQTLQHIVAAELGEDPTHRLAGHRDDSTVRSN